jgi:hypothetical protein
MEKLDVAQCDESTPTQIMAGAQSQNIEVFIQCCNHQKRNDGGQCNEDETTTMIDF